MKYRGAAAEAVKQTKPEQNLKNKRLLAAEAPKKKTDSRR